ncbi:MAG: hypothetical protein AB2A00_22390 [Myxococcota bacterium]
MAGPRSPSSLLASRVTTRLGLGVAILSSVLLWAVTLPRVPVKSAWARAATLGVVTLTLVVPLLLTRGAFQRFGAHATGMALGVAALVQLGVAGALVKWGRAGVPPPLVVAAPTPVKPAPTTSPPPPPVQVIPDAGVDAGVDGAVVALPEGEPPPPLGDEPAPPSANCAQLHLEARTLMRAGRTTDAEAAAQRYFRECPAGQEALALRRELLWARLGPGTPTTEAERVLKEIVSLDPLDWRAWDALAELAAARDELAQAIEYLERARGTHPSPRSVDARITKWRRVGGIEQGFGNEQVDGFIVRYEGRSDPGLGQETLTLLRQVRDHVATQLDLRPVQPITVVIYTGEQYAQLGNAPDWSGGLFDGRIRIRGREGIRQTLFHEYVHALLAQTALAGAGTMPVWLNEGLARRFEWEGAMVPRWEEVRDLLRGQPRRRWSAYPSSFAVLPPEEALRAYTESLSIVLHLEKRGGMHGLTRLLSRMAAGDAFEQAFRSAFHVDLAEAEAQWLRDLQ